MLLYWSCVLALMATFRCSTADQPLIYGTAKLEHNWLEGFKVNIAVLRIPYPVSDGWRMTLIFSQPISHIRVWRAEVMNMKTSADLMTYALKEKSFNKKFAKGYSLTFAVNAYKKNKNLLPPGKVTVLFKGGKVIPSLPTKPPPTTPAPQQQMHQLKPIDESDSGFKMIIDYQVPKAVSNWRISLKFTKDISTENFAIDKAKITLPKEKTCNFFCLGPLSYNENLQTNSNLRLEFSCNKAKLYEAAPNAFFVFHPDSAQCEDLDLPIPGPVGPQESADAVVTDQWPPDIMNNFKMKFDMMLKKSVRGGWNITLKFSEPVAAISNLNIAKVAGNSEDRRIYQIENVPGQIQYANMKQCENLKIDFGGKLVAPGSDKTLTATVSFERKEPEYAEVDPQMVCPP